MKKVNLFLAGCSDIYGGPIRSTFGMTNGLKKLGHTVCLFSQAIKSEASIVRENTIFRGTYFANKNRLFKLGFVGFVHGMRADRGSVNIINGIWHPYYLCVLLGLSLTWKNIHLIFPRGALSDHTLKRKSSLKICFLRIYMLMALNGKFVATSETEKKDVEKIVTSTIEILPNILDIRNVPQVDLSCHDERGPTSFIFISRLDEGKGILELLDALVLLDGDWTLSIYGNDDVGLFEHIQNFLVSHDLTNKVFLHPHIPNEVVLDKLKRADCLVFPSKSENFGNIVVEAFSQGTPVITTVHTPWIEIEKKKLGFLCDGSSGSILEAMQRFIGLSHTERRILQKSTKQYYKNHLTMDILLDRLEEIINGCN